MNYKECLLNILEIPNVRVAGQKTQMTSPIQRNNRTHRDVVLAFHLNNKKTNMI